MDATAWDARYAASELVWSAGPNQFVEEGRNSICLASRGWATTATDLSAVALTKGRTLPGGDAVSWVCADLAGEDFDVARAERVEREVESPGSRPRTAYDALVRLVRQT
jgi:hypothetical protein